MSEIRTTADHIGKAMTVICHPDDCRFYVSPHLFPDAHNAFHAWIRGDQGARRFGGWVYVSDSNAEDVKALRERMGDMPTHPGEYVERTLTASLRDPRNTVMVSGTRIYVSKGVHVMRDGFIVREQSPMESVGNIGLTGSSDGNVWRVLIYSCGYPQTFPVDAIGDAQDYALSCFNLAPKD